ncbi:hypothetical protein [Pectobacterium sp. B2J-2]|uniref:hypothetical protein n=1 Tax=Pectobacterium sp. B2J-2 TaxID=3385372 RepID=UPI0038FC844F
MATLLNQLARHRSSAVDLLCVISDIEGELTEVGAFETLQIGCIPDEDGFTDNDWRIINIARHLGEAMSLDLIPANYRHYVDDVILQGKKVGQELWDSAFQSGVQEGEYTLCELSSEGDGADDYIEGKCNACGRTVRIYCYESCHSGTINQQKSYSCSCGYHFSDDERDDRNSYDYEKYYQLAADMYVE